MHLLKLIDQRSDQEKFLTGRLLDLAKKYKVRYSFYASKHDLMVASGSDGSRALICACGWKKQFSILDMLTTKAPVVVAALEEHVLSFTDPNHYTYYPQGV